MSNYRSSSENLLNRSLATCDLIYANLLRRYPNDSQVVFVRRVTCELNQCEQIFSRLWLILSHKSKLSIVMMLEEFNFALLRKSWKPDFLRVYNSRFLPICSFLYGRQEENALVIQRGMELIYTSIDNTFLPPKRKDNFSHDHSSEHSRPHDRSPQGK